MSKTKSQRRIEEAMVELGRMARAGQHDAIRSERAGAQLTGAAQRILHQITAHGPVRMAELARRTQTDPGILTRQVDLLAKQGLVQRRPDPDDGRALLLELTLQGRRAATRLREVQDDLFAGLLAGWPSGELERLAELMERLLRDLRG